MSKQEQETKIVTEVKDTNDCEGGNKIKLKSVEDSSSTKEPEVVINVSKEDIALVMKELDFSKEEADALLRNNGGDIKLALKSYIHGK